MSAPVNTGSIAKLLWPGLDKVFGLEYTDRPTEYTDLYDIKSSKKAYEEQQSMMGLGLPQVKGEGNQIFFDSFEQAFTYRYTNVTYTLGFGITKEAIEDAQYDLTIVGQNESRGLGRAMRLGREYIGANRFNLAFDTGAGSLYGDGYQMIGAAQPTKSGATFANCPVNAAGTAIGVDLSELALEQACIDIAGFTDDRGNLVALSGQSLHIPRQLEFEAARILQSVLQSDSTTNNLNALKSLSKFPKGVIINHYSTDPDAFFIRTDIPTGTGLVWFDRVRTEFAMDNDFTTTNALYTARFRASCGISDKRACWGSQGA
jgi:hypothetical protein